MWKVVCIIIQGNKIAGYDLISDKGAKQSVTPQQLYNAIINRAVVNAAISDGRIVVKEPFQKRVVENTFSIPFTESELRALMPYMETLYAKLSEKGGNDKARIAIGHFFQVNNLIGQ